MSVLIYTDGGYRFKTQIGAWGYIIINTKNNKAIARAKAYRDTTNNRMELSAVLEALKILSNSQQGTVISDSKYTINCCESWLPSWKSAGWTKRTPGPLKNIDILKDLDRELQKHSLVFKWIKGHSGNYGNEFVDDILNLAMDQMSQGNEDIITKKFEQADPRFFENIPWG